MKSQHWAAGLGQLIHGILLGYQLGRCHRCSTGLRLDIVSLTPFFFPLAMLEEVQARHGFPSSQASGELLQAAAASCSSPRAAHCFQ